MDLLNRYIHAVRFWLPRDQQDDVAAELADDLRSQIDEQESRLGRALNDSEVAAILKQCGSPTVVANRYRPQRYLIGPALFPVYRFVLIIVALCYLVPWLLTWIGLAAFDPRYEANFARAIGPLWGTFWLTILVALGGVTLIFAILERAQPRLPFLNDWDPCRLPEVRDARRIPRVNSTVDLAVNLTFAAWSVTGMWSTTIFDRAGVRITLTSAWRPFLWVVLLIALANIILAAANLIRPWWTWLRASVQMLLTIAASVAFCWICKANLLAEIVAPNLAPSRAAEIVKTINLNLSKSFPSAVAACAVIVALSGIGWLVRLRSSRNRPLQLTALALVIVGLVIPIKAGSQTVPKTPAASFQLPSDAAIQALLADHVDQQHKSTGMVVGVISPQGRHVVSYGHLDQGDVRPLNGDTVFEIGSITKIFTTLLLSDMALRGEVALSDPVVKYLPAGTKVPERSGRQITLADLATHTSGLPFLPSDFPGAGDPANFGMYMPAVSKYSDQALYQFLSTYQLPVDPGSHWAYSNLGVGLLGEALARRAGVSYDELVRTRITGPLGMASTSVTLSPAMRARFAVGHDAALGLVPEWDMPVFAGAGSLHSTANDLLTFLAAFLGHTTSPLSPAMAAMLGTRRPGPSFTQALGWWIIPFAAGHDVVLFGGETLGFASTIAYDPETRVGVIVLSNGSPDDGGIGLHVLRPAYPVATAAAAKAVRERKEIVVDPQVLDRYAGQYRAAVGGIITIARRGNALLLTSDSAPQGLRLHASDDRTFFVTETEFSVTFDVDSQHRVTGLVVHFAGTDTAAPRIDRSPVKN